MTTEPSDRRPLKTRGKAWVAAFTSLLLKTGITPNQISVLSVVFALIGALCFYYSPGNKWLLLLAAVTIQLRLLANMMDGLVAVEGGRRTHNGDLYNEVPDRIADLALLVAAGYATSCENGAILGWLAGAGALMTPYIRMQGAVLSHGKHDFCGPFAKPQRMFTLTVAAVLAPFLTAFDVLYVGLVILVVGTWFTVARRTYRISRSLKTPAA